MMTIDVDVPVSFAQKQADHMTKFHDRDNPRRHTLRKAALQLASLGNAYTDELIEFINSLYIDPDYNAIQSSEWLDDEETILYRISSWAADIRTVADNLEALVGEGVAQRLQ